MKKVLIAVTAMALMAGVTAISVNAAEEKDMKGYVTVSTSANTEISPDVVEVSIAVKTSDAKSMQKATLDNKETSDKVYNALKLMIDTTKGDYIKTSDYNATPVYRYTNNKRVLDKYEVSNSIVVKTKNISKVGDMIDKAISLVANGSISGFKVLSAFIEFANCLYQYCETSSGVFPSFSAFFKILSSTSVTLRQYVTS